LSSVSAVSVSGVLVAVLLAGCAVTPAGREAIRQARAERDAERSLECEKLGAVLVAGACLPCK